jgi:hydroxymethylpyrimidine kinase/phosphomethylpyrimidine kinase
MAGDEVVQALLEHIAPLATLLTPNAHELAALVRTTNLGGSDTPEQAMAIIEKGTGVVLVTGGDSGEDPCEDLLFMAGVDEPVRFTHPRIAGKTPRGTGCALSTAITAFLSRGQPLPDAVGQAVDYVVGKINNSKVVGQQRLLFPGKEGSGVQSPGLGQGTKY